MHLEAITNRDAFLERVWNDQAFHARLVSDPKTLLKEIGMSIPAETEVRVVEDSDKVIYLRIPAVPAEDEIDDDDLLQVQGGTKFTLATTVVAVAVVVVTSTLDRC